MGKLIREMDWSKTPLGPIESWPQSLRTTVSLCLASNFPISIAWGPQRTQIYNDGYWPICGAKHPHSMGQDFRECWFSAWPAIGEAFERASVGETSFLVNRRMFLDRNGCLEETFFTFSFSPIRDETSEVGGLFHPVTEMTDQTLAERRLKVLRDLADRTAEAKTVGEACTLIAEALGEHELDLPFALLFLFDADGKRATLAASSGIQPGTAISPVSVDLSQEASMSWPLAEVARAGQLEEVNDLERRFGSFSCGPYPEPPKTAYALPIILPGLEQTFGALVAGVSSRRALDDAYRTFYRMLSEGVSNALSNARAYEEERKCAEALAEIDRAKTVFFSNVSHEFRTPLSLMLGPLEDTLAEDGMRPQARARLEVARHNGLRLLKLVNTLLDFSRIEAWRIEAVYEPVDLAKLTTDLASVFRSAVERAGLKLVVDCPPLSEPVYVDREMWEKIVLNLLSNAFKFTFEGEIEVGLRIEESWESGRREHPHSAIRNPRSATLTVRDTGTGIPEAELPRQFERFNRVKGARGRSYEGSGIGLALVQELVKAHGGEAHVESEVDRGSKFTVMIPLGKAHLPAERIGAARARASTGLSGEAYVEEALRWLPEEDGATGRQGDRATGSAERHQIEDTISPRRPVAPSPRPRVLLADDNADMREYVRRLLGGQYEVEAVADGEAALNAVRERIPALVLADVMMPNLDGFGLLRELRADKRLKTVPVILLSARAGEEARVEGLEAGADDYLVKPFSARELLARVEAHVKLHRVRREAERAVRESERRFREMIDALPAAIYTTDAEGRLTHFNPAAVEFSGRTPELGTDQWCVSWKLYYPDGAPMPHDECPMAVALNEGRAVRGQEAIAERPDGARVWFEPFPTPLRDSEGRIVGGINMLVDITERKKAEEKLAQASQRLQAHMNNSPLATVEFDPEWRITAWSRGAERMFGWSAAETLGKRIKDLRWVHEADAAAIEALCADMIAGQRLRYNQVNRNYRKDGSVIECEWYNSVLRDANGRMVSLSSQVLDITEHKRAEMNLAVLAEISHDLARLTGVDEIMRTVGAKIGEYLNLSLCAFIEINEAADEAVVTHNWHRDDAPDLVGVYRIGDFVTSEFQEASRAGKLFVVCDTGADPRANAGNFAALKVGSFVSAPLIRDGQWRFLLVATHSTAHGWRDDEIELIGELTTRIWAQLERVRALEALRRSEERFRAIVSQATAGIVEIDLRGRLIFANQRFCEIIGYSEAELRALRMHDITHPDDLPVSVELVSRLAEGGPDFVVEKRYVRKDGGEVWVNNSVNAVRDAAGRVRSIVAVTLDITERRRAEMALAEALALNRTITDNTQSCLWMMDTQGRGTFANPASERVSGFKPEELIGQALHEKVHHTHPDGTPFPIEECPLDNALPLQEAVVGYEDVFVHKDGHFYPVRCAARPIIVNGEPIGTVIEVQDITEERRAAAERELLLEQVASVALEKQRLYEQEQEARQMAEQATRAKDEFLAVVSHELRSPLNSILGWNRLLRSQRGDDPQIARVTETVETSGKAQLRLIEDLLDTARIISGKMRLETQPVELVEVIATALDAVRPAADSKGIVIVPDFSPKAGETSYQITGDPDRLQQVVWNLASNAIKFTPEGGRVWIELRRGGPGVQIIVRDTGQGISPDLLPYVFDRFKQGDSSVSRRFGGLGLGLALVKHLVEIHGGSVMVESPGEGQGSTFTVSLPVRAVKGDVEAKSRGEWETVVALPALRGTQPASLSGLRALVVEDEAGARELITLAIEQQGALVTGVDSAAAALAALESKLENGTARAPFDVLISDIGMPGADGYELIRRVRSHADERVSGIRAIALTAYARTEDRLRALRAGFHMHVPKPVDETELTTVIAALTGRTPGHG